MAAIDWHVHSVQVTDDLQNTDWQLEEDLKCEQLTRNAGEAVDSATLLWQFGSMTRYKSTDETPPHGIEEVPAETANAYVPRREDLVGKFVRIVIDGILADIDLVWIGYILSEETLRWAQEDDGGGTQRITGGDQLFRVVGLEWFLSQQVIAGSSSVLADRQKTSHTYNGGSGQGRDVVGASRANKNPDFAGFQFDENAVLWNAWQIVEDVLLLHTPRDTNAAHRPCSYEISEDTKPYLEWFEPTVQVEGRTVLSVIGEIISQRRGLVWWTRIEEDENIVTVWIEVSSVATADLELPDDKTLPAAATLQPFYNPDDWPTSQPPTINDPGYGRYDIVRVRGARRTSTFSAVGDDLLTVAGFYSFPIPLQAAIVKKWSDDNENQYHAGVSLDDPDYATYDDDEKADRNDRYRQTARFERTYKNFWIQPTPDVSQPLSPQFSENESIIDDFPALPEIIRLERTTMLRAGYSYEDAAAPLKNGEDENREEYVRPFVLLHLPSASINNLVPTTLAGASVDDGGFRFAHLLTKTKEIVAGVGDYRFKFNIGLSPLAAGAGFLLSVSGAMPHAIANLTTSSALEPSRYPVEFLNGAIAATVTAVWEAYCEATYGTPEPAASVPVRELLVNIGERARYDWLAKGTIYDLDQHGHPLQVQEQGALRDDTNLCRTVAQIAHQWYSEPRKSFTAVFNQIVNPLTDFQDNGSDGLGTLIQDVGEDAAAITVNAPVVSATHDLRNNRSTYRCGAEPLDPARLVT